MTLLSAAVDWDPSGVPLTDWHDEFKSEPAVTFNLYQWGSTTIVDPANVAMSTGSSFSHALNNYVINQGSSNDFMLDFAANLMNKNEAMYRHGFDWGIGLDYQVSNLNCHMDLRGLHGPAVVPNVPPVVNAPTFVVSAAVTDTWPGEATNTITQVYFEVYDSTGLHLEPY